MVTTTLNSEGPSWDNCMVTIRHKNRKTMLHSPRTNHNKPDSANKTVLILRSISGRRLTSYIMPGSLLVHPSVLAGNVRGKASRPAIRTHLIARRNSGTDTGTPARGTVTETNWRGCFRALTCTLLFFGRRRGGA